MATYKFYGSKRAGERTDRVKLDADRFLQVGGEAVELSEEEAETLRSRGLDIRAEDSGAPAPQQQQEDNPDNDESQSSREEVK